MIPRPSGPRLLRLGQGIARRWSSTISRFTIHSGGNKNNLISALRTRAPDHVLNQDAGQDALVILASRSHAAWLSDQDFMSKLFDSLSNANSGANQEVNVLSAVVDGLLPQSINGFSRQGFSVCGGSTEHLLPGLWNPHEAADSRILKGAEPKAALTFSRGLHLPSESPGSAPALPVSCSLPLANTIFQNQRPFTLLASRWRRGGPRAPFEMTQIVSKTRQDVNCFDASSGQTSKIRAPLLPITPPRKILAGLGNIVRQIEVGGTPTPASKELEVAVQRIYDEWEGHHEELSGPIGVWGLVIPPEVAGQATLPESGEWPSPLKNGVANEGSMVDEQRAWLHSGESYITRALGRGARLYRVVGGGGGWGKKQGLLSLDAETKFSAPGEDELDDFIQSFQGDATGTNAGGVVARDATIQFFAPSHNTSPVVSQTSDMEEAFTGGNVFGVAPQATDDGLPATGEKAWDIVPGLFGGVSNECFYVSAEGGGDGQNTAAQTKISVPSSFLRPVCAAGIEGAG